METRRKSSAYKPPTANEKCGNVPCVSDLVPVSEQVDPRHELYDERGNEVMI